MKAALALITIGTVTFLLGCPLALALDPSLEVSQYGHTAWTARDGFSVGSIFAMAQTPDGYLWLGSEFGLFRFDGLHAVPWQPPAGQQLPQKPYALLASRDGTLWIGTFAGLVSWDGRKLTQYPEIGHRFVTSLLEDHEGTVWAGILYETPGTPNGRVCAIRNGTVQCYLNDGAFGSFVWSLAEDRSGTLWAGAESGYWRWKPGSPKRYPTSARVGDMATSDDAQVIFGISGGGLRRLVADTLESFPIHSPINRNALLAGREVDSNKLLRDRDGGLWIGTHQHGLIHVHNGRTDARVGERTRIARDLHDTLLQSFHGLLLRFQTVSVLLPEHPTEAKERLDTAIDQAAGAITEGRDAVQGLRASTVERNDLALAISTLGQELENDSSNHRPVTFRVSVEGQARDLHPILRDEIYKIAAEALRNAFHHAQAKQVEVEIRYDDDQLRLRVRDDGKGMDAAVLSSHGLEGHYGLRGMRERATLIKGKLVVWSEVEEGTEVELRIPAEIAYVSARRGSWFSRKVAAKAKA